MEQEDANKGRVRKVAAALAVLDDTCQVVRQLKISDSFVVFTRC